MKKGIKVTFMIDKDSMSDEEYENQEEQTFIITEDEIKEMIKDNHSIKVISPEDTIDNIELKIVNHE